MRKVFAFCGLLLFTGLVPIGAQASVTENLPGVYVAPKFIYGSAVMDKLKGSVDVNSPATGASVGTSDGESDDAFGGALAIGYDFSKRFRLPLRAELEYSILSQVEGGLSEEIKMSGPNLNTSLDQELDIQTLFLNVYYDIKTGTPFTPYLGAGIGLAFIGAESDISVTPTWGAPLSPFDVDGGTESSTNFAWNVGAGAAWAFTDNLSVDLGYRFASLGEAESDTLSIATALSGIPVTAEASSKAENLYMHQVLFGLRYTF